MIHANELRIGNELEDGTVDGIHPHSQIPTIELLKNDTRIFVYLDLANPIPLTEEWLLKFGLSKYKDSNIFVIPFPTTDLKKLATFKYRGDEWGIGFADYYTGHEKSETLPTLIRFVHQLQNLYFALTGTELTITPSTEQL